MAIQLFRACNDKANDLCVEHFCYYYNTWQYSEDAVHLGIYFNIKVEKHVYVNGSRKKQLEIVDFLDNDEPTGTGFGKLYTKAVRMKIKHIRTNVRYYC